MNTPLPNTYWVLPGRLLAGEHPVGGNEKDARQRIGRLLAAGVDSFFDLTCAGELPDYQPWLPPHAQYQRFSLLDHAPPRSAAQMRVILGQLSDALDRDRVVYVHCRAGIGRTGTTVGCFLIEQGQPAHQALETLNQLWQQCARSRNWPRIPETDAQTGFVLRWRASAQAGNSLESRCRGALLGLAVGDALSVPSQGLAIGQFQAIDSMRGGGPMALTPGAWTDDTALAMCAAESLLDCGRVDTRDQMRHFRHWLERGEPSATGTAVGVRPSLRKAVALAAWRRAAVVGANDPRQLDAEPLVRCVSPALYFHQDPLAAMAAGGELARVTHQAPILVDACRLFTRLLVSALTAASKTDLIASLQAQTIGPLKPEVRALAEAWSTTRGRPSPAKGAILAALDSAVQAFLQFDDFAEGLLWVVNQGGDSDVVGGAYGQLAGAFYGEGAIPEDWTAALAAAPAITALAERLLKAGAVSLK